MQLLNQFGPFSDSWHAAVSSDIKHTMHGMYMHNMGVHDVVMHYMAVHDVGMPGMSVPKMDVYKM
jgi:hypothetical protein